MRQEQTTSVNLQPRTLSLTTGTGPQTLKIWNAVLSSLKLPEYYPGRQPSSQALLKDFANSTADYITNYGSQYDFVCQQKDKVTACLFIGSIQLNLTLTIDGDNTFTLNLPERLTKRDRVWYNQLSRALYLHLTSNMTGCAQALQYYMEQVATPHWYLDHFSPNLFTFNPILF